MRVGKKLAKLDELNPNHAIILVNAVDPQTNTVKAFTEACEKRHIPFQLVLNKMDAISDHDRVLENLSGKLGTIIPISALFKANLESVEEVIRRQSKGSRIVVLGVFNTGKTTLINQLTHNDYPIGDIPGTTSDFVVVKYDDYELIDTVGTIVDIGKPLMISADLSGCATVAEKLFSVMTQDANGILASRDSALPGLNEALMRLKDVVKSNGRLFTSGSGASASVAKAIAGQATECGFSCYPLTNDMSEAQPITFSKGVGEDEGGLSRYFCDLIRPQDALIAVSASGGTGFVFDLARRVKEQGALVIAITENLDSPLAKNCTIVVKSNAKPEGPSSSKIQVAHLAIGHALILTLAEEYGVTADESVGFMLHEAIPNKRMGVK